MIEICYGQDRKIVEKGENAGSPFPTMFSKGFLFQGHYKSGLCGQELIIYHTIPTFNNPR